MGCWKSFNNVLTVEPFCFIIFAIRMFNSTAFQELLYQKLCQQSYSASECSNSSFEEGHPNLQGMTSTWLMYSNIASTVPAIFTLVFLSGYSDKHSIRFVMFLPGVSHAVFSLWCILNAYFMSWPTELCLISSVILGLAGYYPAPLMACASYIVRDCQTAPESLGVRMGMMETALLLGMTVASFAAGPLIQYYGIIIVFSIMFVLSVLVNLDVALRLREPEGGYNKSVNGSTLKQKIGDLFSFSVAITYFRVLAKKRAHSLRGHFQLLTVVFVFGVCSEVAITDVLYIYITKTLGYSQLYYSLIYGAATLSSALGTTLGLYILTRKLNCEAITIGVFGLFVVSVGYGFQAYGNYPVFLWIATILRFPVSYIVVCLRIYSARTVEQAEVSSILGYIATIQCACTLIASLIFNGLYPLFLPYWPGWIYVIASFMALAAIPLATFVQRSDRANGIHI